jgi:4-hydroxy-tetrahydrodipicolinate reductase
MSAKARIGLLGADGRMGREVAGLLGSEKFSSRAELTAEVDQGGALEDLLKTDAIIEFSSPSAVVALCDAAASAPARPVLVAGSTGWKIDERRKLEAYADRAPVILSSNFSTGVLLLQEILRRYSSILDKLGYVPSIVETHHQHKKDAPSGTALSLQRVISPSGPGNVPTESIRRGEVIGDHEVAFQGAGDRLVFGHFAGDRSIFAVGAIDAALWLIDERRAGRTTKGLTGMDPYFNSLLAGAPGVQR